MLKRAASLGISLDSSKDAAITQVDPVAAQDAQDDPEAIQKGWFQTLSSFGDFLSGKKAREQTARDYQKYLDRGSITGKYLPYIDRPMSLEEFKELSPWLLNYYNTHGIGDTGNTIIVYQNSL